MDGAAAAYRFPWRGGTTFNLLCDGAEFFPDMLAGIDAAQRSIRMELYLVESGRNLSAFIDALERAVERGVYVQLRVDPIGSRKLSKTDRHRIDRSNIELRLFNNPLPKPAPDDLRRDHRKILIIDDHTAYLGGACITDGFWDPATGNCAWHDLMLKIRGPVIDDVVLLFEHRWRHLERLAEPPKPGEPSSMEPLHHDGMARLAYTAGSSYRGLLSDTIERIRSARHRAWVVTPYFFPGATMLSALTRAAQRGVDVQLILTGDKTDHKLVRKAGQGFYSELLIAGVRISEYSERVLHAKAAVVDEWLSIGSCNFDTWGSNVNLEANIEVYDHDCRQQTLALFDRYRESCRPVELHSWQHRPLSDRLIQYCCNMIGRVLAGLLTRSARYRRTRAAR